MLSNDRLLVAYNHLQDLRRGVRTVYAALRDIETAEMSLDAEIKRCMQDAKEQLGNMSKADKPMYEPTTIAGVLSRLKTNLCSCGLPDGFGDWAGVEADLTKLVEATGKAQARRDATLCFKTACSDCGKLILNAEGLE